MILFSEIGNPAVESIERVFLSLLGFDFKSYLRGKFRVWEE